MGIVPASRQAVLRRGLFLLLIAALAASLFFNIRTFLASREQAEFRHQIMNPLEVYLDQAATELRETIELLEQEADESLILLGLGQAAAQTAKAEERINSSAEVLRRYYGQSNEPMRKTMLDMEGYLESLAASYAAGARQESNADNPLSSVELAGELEEIRIDLEQLRIGVLDQKLDFDLHHFEENWNRVVKKRLAEAPDSGLHAIISDDYP